MSFIRFNDVTVQNEFHDFFNQLLTQFSDDQESIFLERCHKNVPLYLQKLRQKSDNEYVALFFLTLYLKYLAGDTGQVDFAKIDPLKSSDLIDYQTIQSYQSLTKHKVGILKLNGGLGTSMGCVGPKSLIPVVGEQSFLDITVKQIASLGDDCQFLVMNSFNTQKETQSVLADQIPYIELLQHAFPKIDSHSGQPFSCEANPLLEWNPPGHGEVFLNLWLSGKLDQLIVQGIQHLMISNIDNLGAVFDPSILHYMVDQDIPFLMEVAEKTRQDVKGGTVIRKDAQLNLLERAQVADDFLAQFEDISVFKVFNTNTIWVNLIYLKKIFEKAFIQLPLIVNPKTVNGQSVVQLECAMGAAIRLFEEAKLLVVPRHRFLPVKKTSDLLVVQSDVIQKQGSVFQFHKDCSKAVYPEVILSDHFKSVDDYQARVQSIPSLRAVKRLVLDGNIIIQGQVTFRGNVEIINTSDQVMILKDQIYEDVVIKK